MIADKLDIKRYRKQIKHWYWKKCHQHLVVGTYTVREPSKDCFLDIHLCNPSSLDEYGSFLFSICNLNGFWDYETNAGGGHYLSFDGFRASFTPYYFNRMFFVPTWKPLTDEDILKATRYFVKHVLGMKYEIWNYSVQKQIEESNEENLG